MDNLTHHLQTQHTPLPAGVWQKADRASGFHGALTGAALTAWLRSGIATGTPSYHEALHQACHESGANHHEIGETGE